MCIEGWGRYCDFGGRDLYNIPHFREHINSSFILSIVIYNSHTTQTNPPPMYQANQKLQTPAFPPSYSPHTFLRKDSLSRFFNLDNPSNRPAVDTLLSLPPVLFTRLAAFCCFSNSAIVNAGSPFPFRSSSLYFICSHRLYPPSCTITSYSSYIPTPPCPGGSTATPCSG